MDTTNHDGLVTPGTSVGLAIVAHPLPLLLHAPASFQLVLLKIGYRRGV